MIRARGGPSGGVGIGRSRHARERVGKNETRGSLSCERAAFLRTDGVLAGYGMEQGLDEGSSSSSESEG